MTTATDSAPQCAPVHVYVCSTVRHVLFAILRASMVPHEQHHILYFTDFQNASLAGWNTAALGAQIHIHPLTRASFRDQLGRDFRGRALYFLAMRNLAAPAPLREALWDVLRHDCPEFAAALAEAATPALWLFNERNKMARLLRILMPRFNLLEEGEANYHFVDCPWWKWPVRLALGRPPRQRCFGEDGRCQHIYALEPQRLPAPVRLKARPIRFLEADHVKGIMHDLFPAALFPATLEAVTILATQPLEVLKFVTPVEKQRLYSDIVALLRATGRDVRLKLHPAEDPESYSTLLAETPAVSGKLPIEALIMVADTRLEIVSLWSTAGLGFDHNCVRVPLIATDHQATLQRWLHDANLITAAVNAALPPRMAPDDGVAPR